MIIVKIQGGLGNQLFQYAFGRDMALFHKTNLKLDISLYETYEHHAYSLSPFNITEDFASHKEIREFKRYSTKNGRVWKLYNKLFADRKKYVMEKQFMFDPSVFETSPNAYFNGYWQTEKYFKDIEDIIRKEFTLKVPLSTESENLKKSIESVNAVSLHVRRGLYVTNPVFAAHHGSCSPLYYEKAIQHMGKFAPNPHFFIFSDDPKWARENIKPPYPTTYIEHTTPETDYEDITLMSMCRHHILANSTFSWWGAWLNPRKDKIVIAPQKWSNAPKNNTMDLFPDGWITL